DTVEIAVALGVVEAIAHDEPVRDVPADVAGWDLDLERLWLAQQGADLDARRTSGLEVFLEPSQREPRVDDVLRDEHVTARDVGVEFLHDADDAGRLGATAVGRHRHPVELDVTVERLCEVIHERGSALEDADHEEVAA